MRRTIAVIMSVYKNDKVEYVKLAVESILQQTYTDIDFYIQFDGPVASEVDEYLSNLGDDHLHIRKRDKNLGLGESLNELLSVVMPLGYEYIGRMDADDISMPDRFEKQMAYMEAHPKIDCLGGAIFEIDENGESRGKTTYYPETPEECYKFFKKRNPVAHPAVLMRRSLFDKAGSYYPTEEKYYEDLMLWHRVFTGGGKFANLPDVVLNFRMTGSMFSQRRNGKALAKSQLKLRKQINKDLGYGLSGNLYAYAVYLLMISPAWLLKLAYRVLR